MAEKKALTVAGAMISAMVAKHALGFRSLIQRAQKQAARQRQKACEAYVTAYNEALFNAFKPAREAYVEYSKVFQTTQEDASQADIAATYSAQFAYQDAHHAAEINAQKECGQALEAYRKALDEIDAGLGKTWQQAYKDYIAAVRDTMAKLDPEDLESGVLANIAHSIASVASSVQQAGVEHRAP